MRKTWIGVGVSMGVAGAALVAVVACSSSSSVPPPPASSGGQCTNGPGEFPAPNCLPFAPDAQVCQPSGTCNTAPCNASSPCLAMGDNTSAKIASLRMRKLLVTAPAALAFNPPSHTFVQRSVIDQGINLKDQCAEPGDGTFNWLIQFDVANKKVTTGCAPPTTDPFGAGYCFVNANIEGLQVGPVTVDMTQAQDGSWSSSVIDKLYVPIFVAAGTMGAANAPKVIVLPLSKSSVKGVTLSENNNCIGHYNANAVSTDPAISGACVDTDDTTCARWTTAGSLGGFITLDEANGVLVPQLNETLCVLLQPNAMKVMSNPNNPSENLCATDSSGHVTAKGDFCSTTDSPGGCADSFWLSATFAASAAKISATPNQMACMGGVIGGGDGGTTGDAASD